MRRLLAITGALLLGSMLAIGASAPTLGAPIREPQTSVRVNVNRACQATVTATWSGVTDVAQTIYVTIWNNPASSDYTQKILVMGKARGRVKVVFQGATSTDPQSITVQSHINGGPTDELIRAVACTGGWTLVSPT